MTSFDTPIRPLPPGPIRPVREGLLLGPLDDLGAVSLAGSRCGDCGETSLGLAELCPNCGSEAMTELRLADHGFVWTYTVARHRPPGNYRGPEPFAPFGIGLVELPEGLRVVSRLDCDLAALQVGLPVRFTPYYRAEADGATVVAFTYMAVAESTV